MKASEVSSEQLQTIANRVRGTQQNVWRVAEEVLGEPCTDDELFDRLKAEASVVKCEECNTWVSTDEYDEEIERCNECGEDE